tara:strand:- start:298 stop:759 length:462 start_codon:yes stop_codon:yes gene_type:complete
MQLECVCVIYIQYTPPIIWLLISNLVEISQSFSLNKLKRNNIMEQIDTTKHIANFSFKALWYNVKKGMYQSLRLTKEQLGVRNLISIDTLNGKPVEDNATDKAICLAKMNEVLAGRQLCVNQVNFKSITAKNGVTYISYEGQVSLVGSSSYQG